MKKLILGTAAILTTGSMIAFTAFGDSELKLPADDVKAISEVPEKKSIARSAASADRGMPAQRPQVRGPALPVGGRNGPKMK